MAVAEFVEATILAADFAAGAVDTAAILNGTILAADFAAGAVDSAAILDGTIAKVDVDAAFIKVGALADGVSGWIPDGLLLIFTITADAASVGASSFIGVSTGADASVSGSCFVRTRTAATNFVVTCTVAPLDAATLQYMIVN